MSTNAQVKTQAKMPAAPVPARAGQPPVAVFEREAARPDIATQLEGAARLGHSLGAVSVDSPVPPIIQCQELPEEDEEEEELQMKREPAAVQRQEIPEEEGELQMMPAPPGQVALQRQELPEEEEELMMRRDNQRVGLEGGQVPPEVEAAIRRARGGGQPLEGALQEQMSASLGHDFSRVRVHTDSQADDLNQQLQAKAFTTGPDIFFSRGAYEPGTDSGRELIAHELSHVVQQSTGRVRAHPSGMVVRPSGDAFEQAADDVGRQGSARQATSNRALTRQLRSPVLASPADVLAWQRTAGNTRARRSLSGGGPRPDLARANGKGPGTAIPAVARRSVPVAGGPEPSRGRAAGTVQRVIWPQVGGPDRQRPVVELTYEEWSAVEFAYRQGQNVRFEEGEDAPMFYARGDALGARAPVVRCTEGLGVFARPLQGISFGALTSCLVVVAVLNDGRKVAAHDNPDLRPRVSGSQPGAVQSVKAYLTRARLRSSVAQVYAVAVRDQWDERGEPVPSGALVGGAPATGLSAQVAFQRQASLASRDKSAAFITYLQREVGSPVRLVTAADFQSVNVTASGYLQYTATVSSVVERESKLRVSREALVAGYSDTADTPPGRWGETVYGGALVYDAQGKRWVAREPAEVGEDWELEACP
jgi:hypothetical protein